MSGQTFESETPESESIVVDCDLDEPPHQVWRALTEPERLAAWLGPNDTRPEVGHAFQLVAEPGSGAVVRCKVLEVDPGRSLTWSWREERADGEALESRVTWTITPRFDGGSHLRLAHDGFSLLAGRALAMAGSGIALALGRRRASVIGQAFRIAA